MPHNLNQLLTSLSIPATAAAVLAIIFSFLPSENKSDPKNDAKPSSNGNADTDPWLPKHEGLVSFPTNLWEDPFRHLNEAKKAPPNPSPSTGDAAISENHYLRIFTRLLSSEQDRLLILPVILVGDNGERGVANRTKDRHAVEYALTIEGFRQEFPDRMSFASTTVTLTRAQVPIEVQLPIPIKLYKLQKNDGQAAENSGRVSCVILWINREWLGDKPLEVIRQIVENAVFGEKVPLKGQSQVSVIGPNYSEDLRKIVDNVETTDHGSELQKWCAEKRFRLFSHSATFYKRDELKKLKFHGSPETNSTDVFVINTIGTNAQLINALIAELNKRWLLRGKSLIFVESGATSPADLRKAFHFKKNAENEKLNRFREVQDQEAKKDQKEKFIEVPFMRGIGGADGKLSTNDVNAVTDYLVRTMEGQISDQTEREHIKAVGVFANSAEDKLAILRVAKPMFPNATFFTVDMDARYSETANLPFTRNLLVVSHFGLEIKMSCPLRAIDDYNTLNKPLKFRNTYQTSLFLSARLAQQVFLGRACPTRLQSMWETENPQDQTLSVRKTLVPLVLKIGNTGAHQYPAVSQFEYDPPATEAKAAEATGATAPTAGCIQTSFTKVPSLRSHEARWRLLCLVILGGFFASLYSFIAPFISKKIDLAKASKLTNAFWPASILLLGTLVATFVLGLRMIPEPTQSFVSDFWLLLVLAAIFLFGAADRTFPQRENVLVNPIQFGLGALLLSLLFLDHWSSEPISLTSGVSLWPSLMICLLIVAAYFISLNGFLRSADYPWESIQLPNSLSEELIPPVRNLYVFGRQISRQNALWLFVIALLVTIVIGSWLRGVPLSPPPARDSQVILLAFLLQFLAAWGVFWLVGLSLLQTLALRQCIAHSRDLLQERFEAFQNSQFDENLQSDEEPQANQRFERLLEQGRQLVEWAEGASSKSSNALLLPAAMLLLFSISRLPIFDGWHVNSIVLSIILLPFSLTLIGAFLVRRAAHSLRDMVVGVLDHTRLEELKKPTGSLNMKYVDGVTAKLKGLSGGAFRDYLHDPILGSFLLFMSTALTGPGKDIVGYFARMIGLR